LKIDTNSLRTGISIKKENSFSMTPGSITFSEFKENREAAQASSIQNNTWLSTNLNKYSIFFEKNIADFVWRLDAYKRNRDYDALAVLFALPNRMNFQGENDYLSLSTRNISNNKLGRNQIIYGVEHSDWRQDRFFPDSVISTHDVLESNSISYFIKNDLDISSIDTRLSFGYRTEKNERSQLQVLNNSLLSKSFNKSGWEFGLSKSLYPDFNVYTKFSESYRFANIDELASSPFIGGVTVGLLPQTSSDKEIGWKYNFSPRGFLGTRIYVSDLENEIIYDTINFQNINLSPTRRQGLDFDLATPITNTVNLSSTLSIRDAKFISGVNAGNKIPMSANELLTIRIFWNPADAHRFGIDSQWTSKQFVAGDFSNQNIIPSYSTTNIRYSYKKNSAEFSLVVKNLFDRSYFSYATRATENFINFYNAVYPDSGRSLWASIRLSF
jgi:iron complex outermembrane receptor protein